MRILSVAKADALAWDEGAIWCGLVFATSMFQIENCEDVFKSENLILRQATSHSVSSRTEIEPT